MTWKVTVVNVLENTETPGDYKLELSLTAT